AEAQHRVPGEIDRVEFDVSDRVHQRSASFDAAQAALWHLARRYQLRLVRPAGCPDGEWRRIGMGNVQAPFEQFREGLRRQVALALRIGAGETPLRRLAQVACVEHGLVQAMPEISVGTFTASLAIAAVSGSGR